MLPHSCVYKEYLGNTGEGDEWGETTNLTFVKIEDNLKLNITSNGREIVATARLFYDLVNSKGLTNEPINNSKIIFNNKEYKIVESSVLYPNSVNAHHYELLLQ